jgi:hypothetical protein
MYALILARSVEEAASSSRRELWRKGSLAEGGGGLNNLRLCRPPSRSPMAVAEDGSKEAEGGGKRDQRQGRLPYLDKKLIT